MKNRATGKQKQLIALVAALAAANIFFVGCSKAVEQKNTANPFKTNIRSAARQAPPLDAQDNNPQSKDTYTPAEYEKLGDINFKRGNLEAAFLNYEKAFRQEPGDQNLRCKRAWVLVAGNFNADAAKEFEAVLAKKENNAGAREGLGQAYFQMKRYEQAQEEFKKALDIDATLWRSRNYLGMICDHKKDPRQAIQEFSAAIAVKPDSGILYNNLGMAYSMSGTYEEALVAYRKALELGAPRERTLNNIGIALAKLGRTEEARVAFIETGGEARANNNLGCVYLSQGDYDRASKSFETALRSAPDYYRKANDNLKRCGSGDMN